VDQSGSGLQVIVAKLAVVLHDQCPIGEWSVETDRMLLLPNWAVVSMKCKPFGNCLQTLVQLLQRTVAQFNGVPSGQQSSWAEG